MNWFSDLASRKELVSFDTFQISKKKKINFTHLLAKNENSYFILEYWWTRLLNVGIYTAQ